MLIRVSYTMGYVFLWLTSALTIGVLVFVFHLYQMNRQLAVRAELLDRYIVLQARHCDLTQADDGVCAVVLQELADRLGLEKYLEPLLSTVIMQHLDERKKTEPKGIGGID